jgi:hypothetical protein
MQKKEKREKAGKKRKTKEEKVRREIERSVD